MKFYFNGKLIRTSKNHEYKYAILSENDGVWSCHSTLEAAEKEYRKPIAARETDIHECMVAIEMLKNGRNYMEVRRGGRWFKVQLKGKDHRGDDKADVATWEKYIKNDKTAIESLNTRKIVELEARA